MIKAKTPCNCLQCQKRIAVGDWKAKINGFVVCSSCKFKVRVHRNDWLVELATSLRGNGFIPEKDWTDKEHLQCNRSQ